MGDRVRFEANAAEQVAPSIVYDLVTTFVVIHDLVDPVGVLRAIRRLVGPQGVYLMQEASVADRLEENVNVSGQFTYGFGIFHCLPISLAHGGPGLGLAMGEAKARELTAAAGFTRFTRLPVDDDAFYEVRP